MSLLFAFRPGPGRYAPPFGEFAKRHREDRAGLRNLLAVKPSMYCCTAAIGFSVLIFVIPLFIDVRSTS